jgi:hypothetical protein
MGARAAHQKICVGELRRRGVVLPLRALASPLQACRCGSREPFGAVYGSMMSRFEASRCLGLRAPIV